jgi:hypothetical protein
VGAAVEGSEPEAPVWMTTFLGCLITPILSFSTLSSGSEKKNTTNKVKTLGQNNMRKKSQHFSVTTEKRSEVL